MRIFYVPLVNSEKKLKSYLDSFCKVLTEQEKEEHTYKEMCFL